MAELRGTARSHDAQSRLRTALSWQSSEMEDGTKWLCVRSSLDDPVDERRKCTGCRPLMESCNEDTDCCDHDTEGTQCVSMGSESGECLTGECNSPCNDDSDCNQANGFTCGIEVCVKSGTCVE